MSNNDYDEQDRKIAQGLPISFTQEDINTDVKGNGSIVIFSMNGKICFQARLMTKEEAVAVLTQVIKKIN